MAKIICGFPGIGKSSIKNIGKVLDLDSSLYTKNSLFPANYIVDIVSAMDEYDYILVSTHDVLRKELQSMGISYTNVYPEIDLGEEYHDRYVQRGSPESFINFIDENWDDFIYELQYDDSEYVELESGQFLSDIIANI
ncbi:hypothetical protein pEaSNUABM49_00460 [Erwinia phage pEa_SNUABM_49]|nr:hypothetical protein pEaSNUABM49_00460 [Erwinia phage pEa_SNUABM_49]